jgi:hypothetical protein
MALAFTGSLAVPLEPQNVTIARANNNEALAVYAPNLGFIKGEPMVRLKDGRSVRVDLDLMVLPGPGGTAVARARQTFVLSYDLWEERFAVTQAGTPPRSASYLTASAAEAWCLEHRRFPSTSWASSATRRSGFASNTGSWTAPPRPLVMTGAGCP